MHNLFVYGSLLFSEIIKGLTGKTFKSEKISVPGFKRVSVVNADYPALIKDEQAKVEGLMLFDIDKTSLDIITFFEGEEYDKTTIELPSGNRTALTFTWNAGLEYTVDKDWNKERFRKESLQYYIEEIIPETVKAFEKLDSHLL